MTDAQFLSNTSAILWSESRQIWNTYAG